MLSLLPQYKPHQSVCVSRDGGMGGKRKNRIELEVEDKSLLTACKSLFGEEPLENHELG